MRDIFRGLVMDRIRSILGTRPVSGRYLGAVSGPSVETASRPLVRKRVRALGQGQRCT